MRPIYLIPLLLLCAIPVRGQSAAPVKVGLALRGYEKVFPIGWHVVIGGENTWASAMKQRHAGEVAFTSFDERRVYIREKYALEAGVLELRHTLLHEAGHVSCECADEHIAEMFANSH